MSLESIAIIGIGCRFPGADSPEAFWSLLREGKNAIREVPKSRWDVDSYYDPNARKPDKTNTRWGGFLEQVDQFDPHFFGIAPREVPSMDPQQRLILEVAWEALEDGLQIPEQLKGTRTGVFVGIGSHDYSIMVWQKPVNDPYGTTGTAHSMAANRISYVLDLKGPSLAVDTACSSSLVAVHLACQSIWCGESSLALAGGVNALLLPYPMVGFTKSGLMASDGRCKSFDALADGYVRSEGAGMVLLKPLTQARLAGDPIYAVIRGSAINQDGHTEGIATPNRESQIDLLREVYRLAEVAPSQVQYIEAHGTGTKVGDRLELEALGTVLSENRPPGEKCAIGSVKTNIGHLETAAGIAGLIKVALSLQNRQIPPSLHFLKPNPALDFTKLLLKVQERLSLWPERGGPRLAGVNSFGFGGTNAHLILEEALPEATRKSFFPLQERPLQLLTLSAKSDVALQALAMRYREFLVTHPVTEIANICWSANSRRSQFAYRLVVVAKDREQLGKQLAAFAAGQETTGWRASKAMARSTLPQITFLFTGQGSQLIGMGRELYETQPLFRQTIARCAEILENYLDIPLLELLYPTSLSTTESSKIEQTAYTQPALFAIEYALAQLWMSWGLTPSVVFGHSLGEYVAACIAGVFSLEDGLRLVAQRGKLMQALPSDGAMVSVLADEATVRAAMADYPETIAIAAINGPQSWVLSGEKEAIATLTANFMAQGIKTTPLKVSHAFHSPLIEPILAQFRRITSEVVYHSPRINLISGLTGDFMTQDIATPGYWSLHTRQTVRFAKGMATLQKQGCDIFIEIGPQPVLLGMGRAVWEARSSSDTPLWLPSLRYGSSDWQQLLQSLGELYLAGIPLNWSAIEDAASRRLVRLPTYPFQRQSYWWQGFDLLEKPDYAPLSVHPLLSQPILAQQADEFSFQSQISATSPLYLKDHCLGNIPVFPAAAYLEMAAAAAAQVYNPAYQQESAIQLTEVRFEQPLRLSEDTLERVQVILTPQASDAYHFQIFSGESKTVHARGQIGSKRSKSTSALKDLNLLQAQAQCPQWVSVVEHYRKCRAQGLSYGLAFQGIQKLWRGEGKGLGWIELPDFLQQEAKPYQIHPTLLDAGFQVLGVILEEQEEDKVYVPSAVDHFSLYQPSPQRLWSYVSLVTGGKTLKADLRFWDETGEVIADIQGLSLGKMSRQSFSPAFVQAKSPSPISNALYQVVWQAQARKAPSKETVTHWLIFADREGLAEQLAQLLRQKGDESVLVFADQAYSQSEQVYTINPTQPEDLKLLWANLPSPCQGIIHLWGTTPVRQQSLASLQEAVTLGCASVLHLLQAVCQEQDSPLPHLWLVTRGQSRRGDIGVCLDPPQASLWGLGKVIRLEHPHLSCTCLDFDGESSQEVGQILVQELMADNDEEQIAYRQGNRYVSRLVPQESPVQVSPQPLQLKISQYGSLDHLTLVPLTRLAPAVDEVEIQVCAAGVNFRDVLNGLGMLKPYLEEMGYADATEIPFGGECAGTIVRLGSAVEGFQIGDEVIAAFAIGSLASFVRVKAEFVILKPQSLTFVEAATIPTAFLTAYYGLHHLGGMRSGERILIHAAAGGVGQAAVQLAQRAGVQVWATASPAKWDTLKAMGLQQILNSRTLDFAEEIRQATAGQGVDLVLNSLNGEFIPKTLEVLSPGGRFVEIGKIGIWKEEQIAQARGDIAYSVFDLLAIAQQKPQLIATMLAELIPLFEQGKLKPLPQTVFSLEESSKAFRYMAGAKHLGKVVISLPAPSLAPLPIEKDGTYLITGGWGDLGLQVAQWLTQQGARHLILTGRSQPEGQGEAIIRQLEKTGVKIKQVKADLAKPGDVNRLLQNYLPISPKKSSKRLKTEPPLKGIIHAAGILDDGVLLNQTWQRFEAVMNPKIAGTWNLHIATQDCSLDFFICFSSIVSLMGSPGQGSYVAANAFMDALMCDRRRLGLPGLSINWGPWANTAMITQANQQNGFRAKGITLISPVQGLELLGQLLGHKETQVGVLQVDWAQFFSQLPQQSHSPFFKVVKSLASVEVSPPKQPLQPQKEPQQILVGLEGQECKNHLLKYLQKQIAKVLGFSSPDAIEINHDFSDFGLDSLMAVELINILQADLGIAISSNVAFDYPRITALADYLLQEISGQTEAKMPPQQTLGETIVTFGDNSRDNHRRLFAMADVEDIPPQFYQFELFSEYLNLEQQLENAKLSRNPFFTVHDGVASHRITIEGRELCNYSSYNYLGLGGSARVSQAAQEAINQYGTSVSASRILSGEISLHQELEREIAAFLGTESCIVYIGGHATNVSTISHLFQKNDLILYDAFSHNSIRQGCLLSGATAWEFPHNDWRGLEQRLQQHRRQYEKVLIVVEGIYSTDGDLAPLPDIIALKKRYKTFLMVDEAHSFGVLGASGRGISEHFGIAPTDVDLWMGTLSKSFASCGGYIAASDPIVKYLKYTSPGFVFSVGMSPANAAAALAAIRLLKAEPERVKQLQARSQFFLSSAQALGLNTGLSLNSPIIPIIVGESKRAVDLSNALFQEGINVHPMIYPSVPHNAARLRFFLTCDHEEEQIDLTLKKLLYLKSMF